jgi:hypothetical protein
MSVGWVSAAAFAEMAPGCGSARNPASLGSARSWVTLGTHAAFQTNLLGRASPTYIYIPLRALP